MQPRSFCPWNISSYYVTCTMVSILLFILVSLHVTDAKFIYAANLPSTVNFTSPLVNEGEIDEYLLSRLVLFRGIGVSSPCYLSGFICVDQCSGYVFAVVIAYYHETAGIRNRRVVWSANQDNPIDEGAKLQLESGGNLELRNSKDVLVWSSKTTRNASVASLNLTESGNLVLLDDNKSIIWQSFDHPTDTLLMGQKLSPGQMLASSVPGSNSYHLSVNTSGVSAYIDWNIPLVYFKHLFTQEDEVTYVELMNGSI
ncbi:hypothetical protein LIER_14630 [Lithospermum erythrorhizon]|uniref:Bulb-type lectin domain-containing protein n=1 Tax=Lithospermum erythrorhizon TaxID=34254 RepID=A0AAV3PZT7_LITER